MRLLESVAGDMVPAPARPSTTRIRARLDRRALVRALRPLFALFGVLALCLLVRDAGLATLSRILRMALPWLPLVTALEVVRVGADALSSLWSLGERARAVPGRILVRAQLLATAVSALAPAGRAAGEATKAALLAPWTGAPEAAAAATTVQAVALLAGGLISIPCALAAFALSGRSTMTLALSLHAVALLGIGAAMRMGMRAQVLRAYIDRRFRRAAPVTEAFQATARATRLFPPLPIAAMFGGRVLQVVQYAILARAVGVDLTMPRALVAQGANMVSLAVGALVPGQVGVSEGAFAFSADALGIALAPAISIALLAHVLQVVFVPVGVLLPLIWRVSPPSPSPGPVGAIEGMLEQTAGPGAGSNGT